MDTIKAQLLELQRQLDAATAVCDTTHHHFLPYQHLRGRYLWPYTLLTPHISSISRPKLKPVQMSIKHSQSM